MHVETCEGSSSELPALARLHAQCFPDLWDEAFLERLLAQPSSYFVLARRWSEPVGFVIARAVVDEAEIHSLGVVPERRRQGIGEALVRGAADRALARRAATIFLEVSVANAAARSLYRRLGFSEVARRSGYYAASPGPGRDALILRRALPL